MTELTREELLRRYEKEGMCRQCGIRPHLAHFTICRACKNDNIEARFQ